MRLRFIEPGKPVQNAFVESFNGRFRDPKQEQSRPGSPAGGTDSTGPTKQSLSVLKFKYCVALIGGKVSRWWWRGNGTQ